MIKKPVIAFYPPPPHRNHYTDRLIRNIYKVVGKTHIVKIINIRKLQFKNFSNLDIIFLNYYENIIVKKKKSISIFRLLVSIFLFFKIKFLYKKIYYIKHNHYIHNLNKLDTYISKHLINFFTFFSDKKITLSPNSNQNYNYIPHPLYNVYTSKKL